MEKTVVSLASISSYDAKPGALYTFTKKGMVKNFVERI